MGIKPDSESGRIRKFVNTVMSNTDRAAGGIQRRFFSMRLKKSLSFARDGNIRFDGVMSSPLRSSFAFLLLTLLSSICPKICLCQDSSSSGTNGAVPTARIAGGSPAEKERFPYMCSLRATNTPQTHACGGTLIHPLWVLTAAHCLYSTEDSDIGLLPVLYCGIFDVTDDAADKRYLAVNASLHEKWNGQVANGYDIALLRLNKEATLMTPRLNVPNNPPALGTNLGAIGWGETKEDKQPLELQVSVHLGFVSNRVCNRENMWNGAVKEDMMLCAGLGDNDTCQGDSGGPLLSVNTPDGRWEEGTPDADIVYGITSFGTKECGDSALPGVYTDVGHFRNWIDSVMSGQVAASVTPTTSVGTSQSSPFPSASPSASPDVRNRDVLLREMMQAIQSDEASSVTLLLREGLDVNSRYNNASVTGGSVDDTLLLWAARYDSPNAMRVLINNGADLEAVNRNGNAPLHYCAIYGSIRAARVLISRGADVDARGADGFTPLHFAARYGHDDIVQVLLRNDAHTDLRSSSTGETPLHEAARNGHVEIIEILLLAGADVDPSDFVQETPLHEAARHGHLEVARELVNSGANRDMEDQNFNIPQDVVCNNARPPCSRTTRAVLENLLDTYDIGAQGSM